MAGSWWFEYRQERRINRLSDDLDAASARAAMDASALRSRLSQVQGSLEARLNRLATSFDAFVELSGLREQLAMYDLEAAARNRAHRLLIGLARLAAAPGSMSPPPPLDLEDCPGYWLPPAAEGLAALVRGDEAEAERYVAEARARDSARTARFLTLGLAVAGETAPACHWLDEALPPLGPTVSSEERAIWEFCATGGLGDVGRRHLEGRLAAWVAGLSADEARVARNKWRQRALDLVEKVPEPSLPSSFRHLTETAESIRAADQLDRLLAHVEQARGAGGDVRDPMPGLRNLVDAGSVEEVQLLTRIRELRNVIETGTETRSTPADPDTLSVICADAFGEEAGLGWPALLATAAWMEEFVAVRTEIARKPAPDGVSIELWRERVTVRVGRETDLSAVEAAIERAAADDLGRGLGRMARQLTSHRRQEEWIEAEKAAAARKADEALRQWTEHMARCADAADRGIAASELISALLAYG